MIYFSSRFRERYPKIFQSINEHIEITEIPYTNDIWIRDFMPIRNSQKEWILFKYYPKYLRSAKYHSLISDNINICQHLDLDFTFNPLILDAGSIVYRNKLYLISERILIDNPKLSKSKIFDILVGALKTDQIFFLPEAPHDFTGHLDGMLSIVDDKTILINDYKDEFKETLTKALQALSFNIETLPYNPYSNMSYQSAKGIYINFFQTETKLFLPIFNQHEDSFAEAKLSAIFPKQRIVPIDCNDISNEGGLLHCVSWEDC